MIKYVLTLLMLSAMLQPVALQACDMELEQTGHEHAAMQGGAEHDCCEPDPQSPATPCDNAISCGLCIPASALVASGAGTPPGLSAQRHAAYSGELHASPHASPPFRPPIA